MVNRVYVVRACFKGLYDQTSSFNAAIRPMLTVVFPDPLAPPAIIKELVTVILPLCFHGLNKFDVHISGG